MGREKIKADINVFEAIFKDKTNKAADITKQVRSCIKVFVVIVVVNIVAWTGLIVSTNVKISSAEKKLSEEITEEEREKYARARQEVNYLTNQNSLLEENIKTFNETVKMTVQDIQNIAFYQPAEGFTIDSFGFTGGKFTLRCTAVDDLMCSKFAAALRDSKKFEDIEYTGLSKGEDSFSCTVIVTLKNDKVEEGESE